MTASQTNHVTVNSISSNRRVRVHNSIHILQQNARQTMGPGADGDLWLMPNNPGTPLRMVFWIMTCSVGEGNITFIDTLKQPKTSRMNIVNDP